MNIATRRCILRSFCVYLFSWRSKTRTISQILTKPIMLVNFEPTLFECLHFQAYVAQVLLLARKVSISSSLLTPEMQRPIAST